MKHLQTKSLKLILLILIGIVTASCSREFRAQRHLDRAVYLNPNILKTDTVFQKQEVLVHDTTTLERVRTVIQFGKRDSSVKLPPQFRGGKEGTVTIKHKKDGVEVTVDRPADTILKYKTINIRTMVIRTKYIRTESKMSFTVPLITAIFGFLVGAFLTYNFYNKNSAKK